MMLSDRFGPCYINHNGTLIKLNDIGFGTHYAYEKDQEKSSLLNRKYATIRYITNERGWIRLNDGKHGGVEYIVELPIKEITPNQYDRLEKFLQHMYDVNIEFVDVGIEEHSCGACFHRGAIYYKRFYFDEYKVDRIIQEIKQHYKKG